MVLPSHGNRLPVLVYEHVGVCGDRVSRRVAPLGITTIQLIDAHLEPAPSHGAAAVRFEPRKLNPAELKLALEPIEYMNPGALTRIAQIKVEAKISNLTLP